MDFAHRTILFFCLLALSTVMAQNSAIPTTYEQLDLKSAPFQVSDSYLTKHDIIFQAPTDLEAEGFPMGNGKIGVMILNHDNDIEIQINRIYVWSEPIPEEGDKSRLNHAARIKIHFRIPIFSWIHLGDFTGLLSLSNGIASYKGTTGFADTKI